MKNLFKNYVFEFDKTERKLLSTFAKQMINQLSSSPQYAKAYNAFASIVNKLNTSEEKIKLTKEERTLLESNIKKNLSYLKEKHKKSSFLTRWLYKSVIKQYEIIINKHFND